VTEGCQPSPKAKVSIPPKCLTAVNTVFCDKGEGFCLLNGERAGYLRRSVGLDGSATELSSYYSRH